MAQSNFAEKMEIDGLQVEYTDVMTGDKNRKRFLYYQLKMSMLKANKIDIIVSFISGFVRFKFKMWLIKFLVMVTLSICLNKLGVNCPFKSNACLSMSFFLEEYFPNL